jgi:DUF971 family protein
MSAVVPIRLRKEGEDALIIEWSDGKRCVYKWTELRTQCPCAGCREERQQPHDPFRVLKPSELQPLRPLKLEPVGHYAYKIVWSDGHDSGIYSLDFLRQLCGC